MLQPLEFDIIKILSKQKSIPKEELIIRLNLEKQSRNETGLGYRAFKSVMKTLESKSLIVRLVNNSYQPTILGIKELEMIESTIATS